jgi:hypothetical protein
MKTCRMKELKFTKETSTIALAFFIVYFIYGVFYTPVFQLIICLAVGGIAYGMTNSYEIAVIALLAINYLFPFFRGSSMKGVTAYRMEGFAGSSQVKASEITKRIESITGSGSGRELKVAGVGSSTSEGFADAGDMDLTLNQNKKEGEHSDSISASAKPASVNSDSGADKEEQLKKMADMMSTMLKAMNTGGDSSSVKTISAKENDVLSSSTAVKISEQNMPPVHQPQELSSKKEAFASQTPSASEGLFKLGQIPKDVKGGFHIDAGTTVMNAINSLKPDQIKAMTMDTKQLIDTQKSLMGMLQTFQPMVQEGKQMMDTFQEMFSPSMGAMGTHGK